MCVLVKSINAHIYFYHLVLVPFELKIYYSWESIHEYQWSFLSIKQILFASGGLFWGWIGNVKDSRTFYILKTINLVLKFFLSSPFHKTTEIRIEME